MNEFPSWPSEIKLDWAPCVASPALDYAFFDGVHIRTDSMDNPRVDRVFPILVEEQVLMARLLQRMLPKRQEALGRPLKVLDVGTGSGVFSLVAARAGCRVTSVDVSERAIDFFKHNVDLNHAALPRGKSTIIDTGEAPQPGQIRLLRMDFVTDDMLESELYDVIILAPPFNPTHPSFQRSTALHAAADIDGQRVFDEQIARAVPLLAEGGACVGVHMSGVIDAGAHITDQVRGMNSERLRFIKTTKQAFDDAGKGMCIDVLPFPETTYGTKELLDVMYDDVPAGLKPDDIEDFKGRVIERYPSYAVLFFSARVAATGSQVRWVRLDDAVQNVLTTTIRADTARKWECTKLRPTDEDLSSDLAWKSRVDIHRSIIMAACGDRSVSTYGRLHDFGATKLPLRHFYRSQSEHDASVASPALFDAINEFIEGSDLGQSFSMVVVDTAPYASERRNDIVQRLGIWNWADKENNDVLLKCFAAWQAETEALQLIGRAPMPHPAFLQTYHDHGSGEGDPWICPFDTRVAEEQSGYLYSPSLPGGEEPINSVQRELAEKVSSQPPTVKVNVTIRHQASNSYLLSDAQNFEARLLDRQSSADELKRRLAAKTAVVDNASAIKDFYVNQLATHQRRHAAFGELCKIQHVESALMAAPLGIGWAHENHTKPDTLYPPWFLGAMWVMAITKPIAQKGSVARIGRAADDELRRLLRFVWHTLLFDYDKNATDAFRKSEEERTQSALAEAQAKMEAKAQAELVKAQKEVREKLELGLNAVIDALGTVNERAEEVKYLLDFNMGPHIRRWVRDNFKTIFKEGEKLQGFGCESGMGVHDFYTDVACANWEDALAWALLKFAIADGWNTRGNGERLSEYWRAEFAKKAPHEPVLQLLFRLGIGAQLTSDNAKFAQHCWKTGIKGIKDGELSLALFEMAVGARIRDPRNNKSYSGFRLNVGEITGERALTGLHRLFIALLAHAGIVWDTLVPPVQLASKIPNDSRLALGISCIVDGNGNTRMLYPSRDDAISLFKTAADPSKRTEPSKRSTTWGLIWALGLDPTAPTRSIELGPDYDRIIAKEGDRAIAEAYWQDGLWIEYHAYGDAK